MGSEGFSLFVWVFFLLVKNFSLSGKGGRNSAKGVGLTEETTGIFFLGLVAIICFCFQCL